MSIITKTPRNVYLNNKELLKETIKSKQNGKMTNELAKMLQLLVARFATKGNYVNYTYNEDMQAYALLMLVKTWEGFDPEKSSNCFSYYTQCTYHSFLQFLNSERRHRDIRDTLISQQGLNPSFNFLEDDDSSDIHFVDDEQDFTYHKHTNINLTKHIISEHVPITRDDLGLEIENTKVEIEEVLE